MPLPYFEVNMAISNTKICNMALDELGAKRINDLDTDQSPQAIKCRLHFEQTRDALIRSHWWRFARDRASLSKDTVSPDFEWDNQFILPSDFLAARPVFGDFETQNTRFSYDLEGDRLLTNQDAIDFRYIKRVTDPTKFDPLFVEVFVLILAEKLNSLAGANAKIATVISQKLAVLMRRVRTMDKQETNTKGRANRRSWNDSRFTNGGRIDSQLGS
jgi:hypothetical protein